MNSNIFEKYQVIPFLPSLPLHEGRVLSCEVGVMQGVGAG